jgi:hypothetical protein
VVIGLLQKLLLLPEAVSQQQVVLGASLVDVYLCRWQGLEVLLVVLLGKLRKDLGLQSLDGVLVFVVDLAGLEEDLRPDAQKFVQSAAAALLRGSGWGRWKRGNIFGEVVLPAKLIEVDFMDLIEFDPEAIEIRGHLRLWDGKAVHAGLRTQDGLYSLLCCLFLGEVFLDLLLTELADEPNRLLPSQLLIDMHSQPVSLGDEGGLGQFGNCL